MSDLMKTERTRLRRAHHRGSFDRDVVNGILDAQPMCSVGYVIDGKPYVTPTLQWREGDYVYWHGSSASRAIRSSKGTDVCLTVAILDGFVMARSGFHHSVNSRSVMLFGLAQAVPDNEKDRVLTAFIDGLWPGRSRMIRPNTSQELKATTVLRMKIEEGSAKVRQGHPIDDDEDYGLPIWAGIIPVMQKTGPIESDPKNQPEVEIPQHIKDFSV